MAQIEESGAADLIPLWIAQLCETDVSVRRSAAVRLGQAKDRRAVLALIDLLADHAHSASAGQYAAWALGEIGDERAIEPLLALTREKFVGAPAIAALVKFRENGALDQIIRIFRETNSPDLAALLGNWGDLRAMDALIAATHDPDTFVRYYALQALVKFRDGRALDRIIEIYRETNRPDLATVLGNWGDLKAMDALIAATRDPNPHARYYAVRALGKLGDARALPALEWCEAHDQEKITDTASLRGKSVSYAATRSIAAIKEALRRDENS